MSIGSNNMYLGTKHHSDFSNKYEPSRTNNFEVIINDLNVSTPGGRSFSASAAQETITLSTSKFAAPKISVDSLEVHYGNNLMKYAGKAKFDDCSITVYDYIGADVENILMAWFTQVYNVKTQAIGLASEYKKSATVVQYKSNGEYLRSWNIKGLWIKELDLGEYTQDGGLRQLSATLIYDYCTPVE